RLLADIQAGLIDCVLTHRVDRLSRSLLDFARLMETFEQHQVAFVSVTQHFHSGTSMGRLVLNVLLSFAQFERELIAERTRDKMAAARRKGKWGGGLPVLGYDVDASSKKLVINEEEAVRVRAIFALYLQHRGLLPVLAELARRGWCTKQTRTKEGHVHGGRPFTRSSLYRLLTTVTYMAQVRYRNEIHPGEQPAIIDPKSWQEVQALLAQNGPGRMGTGRTPSEALLQGLLFCRPCGCVMTPAQVRRGNRRYRYYTCSAAQRKGWHNCPSKSLPAAAVERYVLEKASFLLPRTPAIRHRGNSICVRWPALRHAGISPATPGRLPGWLTALSVKGSGSKCTYTNTVKILCGAFRVEFESNAFKCERRLIEHAFSLNHAGKALTTILDDAHLMDLANLRKLRLLFEDFPKNHNLVLVGRPSLLAVLDLA